MSIITIIGSVLALALLLVKYFIDGKQAKQKQADEARKKLDDAQNNQNKSDLLDAWDRANRL